MVEGGMTQPIRNIVVSGSRWLVVGLCTALAVSLTPATALAQSLGGSVETGPCAVER